MTFEGKAGGDPFLPGLRGGLPHMRGLNDCVTIGLGAVAKACFSWDDLQPLFLLCTGLFSSGD